MPSVPNKLSQFWQELKRRNVFRVITVYTGAAFVILSLVDMVREPFELPNWSFKLILLILSVGLIIAVIISWIYDIHPEGGMVKTEPADKIKPEEIPESSKGWKIASYVSFVVIAVLIVLNVVPRANHKKYREHSIAILPFTNDSPESKNAYTINGYRTAVHNNLCQIKGLRVSTLQATEKYRNQTKTIQEMAKELGVGYIISANGQILNNRILLTVQLADASGEVIWSNPYDRKIESVENHIDIQSNIAQLVASKLRTTITPEEKERLGKIPTPSLTAYDFYLKGNEEVLKYRMGRGSDSNLKEAAYYFNKALEYDPEYARAYSGLAMIRYYEYTYLTLTGNEYTADYFQSRNLDSMNLLATKALELDDQIAEAYYARSNYERERGNLIAAMESIHQALAIDPNYIMAILGEATILADLYDFVGSIEMVQKASVLEGGPTRELILNYFLYEFWEMGFMELSEHYVSQYASISGDSTEYNTFMYYYEFQNGQFEKALEYAQAGYNLDTTDRDAILILGRAYLELRQFDQAFPLYSRYFSGLDISGDLDVNDMNRMGYVLWMLGKKEEAQHYFQEMISHCKRHIILNTTYGRNGASFDIAGVYAFLGEKDSAYYYLEMFSKTDGQTAYLIAMLQELDPLFEPVRREERFRQLLGPMEAKYQAERERLRQWLEENAML